MSGIEAIKQIKRDQNTPIIALAKLAMAGDSKTTLVAGLDDYLVKLIEFETRDAMIRKWVVQ